MKGRILVLGAAGRLGYVAAETFRDAGWQVKGLVRPGRSGAVPRRVEAIEAVTRDEAVAAAQGCDVVLNAFNPVDHRMAEERAVARLCGDRGGRRQRRDPAVSGQRVELRPRHAAGARREHADAAHRRARAACASRSSSASAKPRPRHARDRPPRRRFLRRRQRLLVRSGDRKGHRARPPHLSGSARRRARVGLSARFRGDLGAARRAARKLSAPARPSAFPAMR